MKIYISYSWVEKENKSWIKKLCSDLKEDGLEIIYDMGVMDRETIDIDRFIQEGMTEADYIIVAITPSYIEKANKKRFNNEKKSWVEVECDYIRRRRHKEIKALIPIIMKKEDSVKLPNLLEGLNYHDMSDEEHYEVELKRIKQIIFNKENKIKENYDINYSNSNKNLENDIKKNYTNRNIKQLECDINFKIIEDPIRISCDIIYGNSKFSFNHSQIIDLMLKYYNVELNTRNEESSQCLITKNIYIELPNNEYKKILNKIRQETENYINAIMKFEADFEVKGFKLLDKEFGYEILEIDRKHWNMFLDIANEYDWDNGKSEWNIFQRNTNYIHVYSPVISYNPNLNSGQHAIFRAIKSDILYNDNVKICIYIRDIINSDYSGYKINKRDVWGVRTAYEWLTSSFIPLICRCKKLEKEKIILNDYYTYAKEDIFSEMQTFYMSYRVQVPVIEIIKLRDALCYCLSKKFPKEDYNYIAGKIRMFDIELDESPQIISERIREFLNSKKFEDEINKYGQNASLADDLLRCIKVFTDNYSKYKLNNDEVEYIKNLSQTLIKKMNDIKLLSKYKNS